MRPWDLRGHGVGVGVGRGGWRWGGGGEREGGGRESKMLQQFNLLILSTN